jgi:hypothetical protein
LIRQQRELLKRTFALREMSGVSTSQINRLATTQQEIEAATQQFVAGIRQRAGDVPPLDEAITKMQAAAVALAAAVLDDAQMMEEEALAHLIRARQNLRNILQRSDSSQAAQCRTFDRQIQQKLRLPEKEVQEEDQQAQQLAQACERLEQLAEQQRQWSRQVCESPASSSGKPIESPSPTTRPQLAQEQQMAIEQAQQVGEQLMQSKRGGELAQQQMEQATGDMQEGLEQLNAGENQDASEAAQRAARRLRQLAEHLDVLNEPEFARQLARASSMAQQLSSDQQQLADAESPASPQPATAQATPSAPEQTARQQRQLAERAEQLDELTARLAAESLEQDAAIHRVIQDARQAHPTDEIAELMREAAEDFQSGQESQATQAAEMAARSLEHLAGDLRRAHEQLTQPDLDKLMAAEEQAAQMLGQMLESRSESERAMVRSKLDELDQTLDPLAKTDPRLAQAQDSLQRSASGQAADTDQTVQSSTSAIFERAGDVESSSDARFEHSDQLLVTGLRNVTDTLQTMIQETILDRALLAPDAAVPPGFEKIVEEYYRALSEDLR